MVCTVPPDPLRTTPDSVATPPEFSVTGLPLLRLVLVDATVSVKVTEPVGVVPGLVVLVTVAVMVTGCPTGGALELRAATVKVAGGGAPPGPVPVKEMVWVEFGKLPVLSVSVRSPVLAPLWLGVKSRAYVQLAPEASDPAVPPVKTFGQVVAGSSPKSALLSTGLAPLEGTLMLNGALPMFISVSVSGSSTVSQEL